MNLKEHLSEGILERLLKNELSDEMRSAAGLHLSYCPVCREQKDEFALKLAAQRMWIAYEQSGSPNEPHIADKTFRHFWLGEIRDEDFIKQLSRHCIICRDCRGRREVARTEIEKEDAGTREWALMALMLGVVSGVWKRRRVIGVVIAPLLLLTFLIIKFVPQRETANQPSPTNAKGNLVVALPAPAPNNNSSEVKPVQEPPVQSSPQIKAPPQPQASPEEKAPHELLARAQTIDLARAPDGDGSRSPDDAEEGAKAYYKIVASRSGPTRLRIGLPANSKAGAYNVSIRDPAFLNELVLVKAKSRNGVSLTVFLDTRNLKTGEYVLRITRRDPQADRNEYIGDYHVFVTRQASLSGRPRETPLPR
jgi:hypothetical protein